MLDMPDISSYQGDAGLRVGNIKSDGIIVKATEGTGYTNPYFRRDADDTLKLGRVLGIYHYASGYNWKAEADYFLNAVGPYLGKAVLILDYEMPAVLIGRESFAKQWLDYVKEKTGQTPWFYTYLFVENGYNSKDNPTPFNWSGIAKSYPLWLAQYQIGAVYGYQHRALNGRLKYWDKMTCFQHTDNGYLPGYGKRLDLNVFYGDKEDWAKWASKDGGVDEEMAWHPEVKYTDIGQFKVNRDNGANLYSDATLTKVIGTRTGSFKILSAKKGAVCAGTGQWFSQADGLTKINPLAINENSSAICKIVADDAFTQNEITATAKGVKHLPKGSKWQVKGRKGKYLRVGGPTDGMYIDADKTVIVL